MERERIGQGVSVTRMTGQRNAEDSHVNAKVKSYLQHTLQL